MTRAVSLAGALFAVVFFIIAGSAYGMLRTRLSAAEVAAVDLRALPYQLGRWRGVDGPGLAKVARDILKLDHALKRTYTDADGNMIDLYIGYWTHQSGEHQAAKHSPAICLPANGWSTWSHSEKLFKFP
ncbi:MAG TPA: EpsI family protein, partial [Oligoflexia bacterium]|nr:EpsI family protein [Oligoflexia bacterium]